MMPHQNRGYSITPGGANAHNRPSFMVKCSKCPNQLVLHLKMNMSPEGVCQKFRNHGWIINERNPRWHVCPKCQNTRHKGEPKMSTVTTLPTKPAEVREPTIREVKRVLDLIGGHFDETKGCYLGKYTDETAARELDLPRALVTKIREGAGMMIKGDPELIAMRQEFNDVVAIVSDFGKKLEALEARHSGKR